MALTDVKVRNAKPGEKQVKLSDSDGMYLLVSPQGGKCWRLKYRFGGKEKVLALGTYPEVSLADARKSREDARKLLANGVDPGEIKKAQKTGLMSLNIPPEYGGPGLGVLEEALVNEQLAWGCSGIQTSLGANGLAGACGTDRAYDDCIASRHFDGECGQVH